MTEASAEPARSAAQPPEEQANQPLHWWLAPIAIVGLSVLLRLIYTFWLGGYEDNLYSDMEGYWKRAHAHLQGGAREAEQWMIQAPLFPVIISRVLGIARLNFTLWDHRLEFFMVLQALFGGLSTGYLYFLTQNLFASRRLSALVSGLHAVSFPLIYLGAFVMTEGISIPLLIAAAFYGARAKRTHMLISGGLVLALALVLSLPLLYTLAAVALACLFHWLAGKDDSAVVSALCLAISVAIRPATLPFAGPFVLYTLFRRSPSPNWNAAALYLCSFFLAVGLVSYYNSAVSSGRVSGLGAGGGIAFFAAQCDYDSMMVEYEGNWYWSIRPGSEKKTDLKTVKDNMPPFEQAHYYRGGIRCLLDNPNPVGFNVKRLGRLYRNSFFPAVDRPPMELSLIDLFYVPLFAVLSLITLLGAPFVFARGQLFEDRHYYLMWSLFIVLIFAHMAFGAEQRYLLPGVFTLYLGSACVLLRLFPDIGPTLGAPQATPESCEGVEEDSPPE